MAFIGLQAVWQQYSSIYTPVYTYVQHCMHTRIPILLKLHILIIRVFLKIIIDNYSNASVNLTLLVSLPQHILDIFFYSTFSFLLAMWFICVLCCLQMWEFTLTNCIKSLKTRNLISDVGLTNPRAQYLITSQVPINDLCYTRICTDK